MKNVEQENKAIELAKAVARKGGRAYFVGGYVRDRLINASRNGGTGNEPKDIDIEIHGINSDDLMQILEGLGQVISIGKNFGVYSLRKYNIDIAIPRLEENIGRGHRNFEIFTDPFLGTEKAAMRRDFTFNALMEDVLSGEILDYFGGMSDLNSGVIRHIDDKKFQEDPLRVLRAAQFAARFDFNVAEETIALCKTMNLSELPKERVDVELYKGMCKSLKPSKFFEVLREMGQLSTWFGEVEQLIGVQQNPAFHPEGDVWNHTMIALDNAVEFIKDGGTENTYEFMLLVLTHDFGKIVTTKEVDGRIRSIGHETEGMPLVKAFLDRIIGNKTIKRYVMNMVPLHMKPNMLANNGAKVRSTNKMFDEAIFPRDLIYFSQVDFTINEKDGVADDEKKAGAEFNRLFLEDRLAIFNEYMARPYVSGEDLIAAGLKPGIEFKSALELAHKHRLAGVKKEDSLRQILASTKKH